MPSDASLSQRYHEATKYTPEALRRHPGLDFSRQPAPFKRWHEARRLSLEGRRPDEAQADPGPLDARRLGRLLHHTYGVTQVRQAQGGTHYFRAAPSAGGLYPAELYVATLGLPGIPDGLHAYDAPEHALVLCWEGDFRGDMQRYGFESPALAEAGAVLIGTGYYRRSAWRYRDRAYRRVLLDTGHVFGNALAAGAADGLGVQLLPDFVDDGLNGLLLLDAAEEGSLLMAALGTGASVATPAARRSTRDPAEDAPTEGYWIPLVHRAGYLDASSGHAGEQRDVGRDEASHAWGPPIELDATPLPLAPDALHAIRTRRSTRMFRTDDMPLSALGRLLAYAYPRPGGDLPGGSLAPDVLTTWLIVAGVAGLPAGAYHYDPTRHALALVRRGDPRRVLHHGCLWQELGRDCAFAVVHTFDLPAAIERFGDRIYRTAHLQAGILGERLALGAPHLGVGTSGIGGFFDDVFTEVLGLNASHAIAYVTTVGLPA